MRSLSASRLGGGSGHFLRSVCMNIGNGFKLGLHCQDRRVNLPYDEVTHHLFYKTSSPSIYIIIKQQPFLKVISFHPPGPWFFIPFSNTPLVS